ncbi:hypothetical protein M9H77_18215 [Catharanthus roseus]|uniref:Uncharacterized protein n=1 Tax=Catharanthus roseus TaxID=4058 RepID=A0ACC0B711_CATRO|nr:hypothetical protein M9H77_18215 [Catharanthus roseus]
MPIEGLSSTTAPANPSRSLEQLGFVNLLQAPRQDELDAFDLWTMIAATQPKVVGEGPSIPRLMPILPPRSRPPGYLPLPWQAAALKSQLAVCRQPSCGTKIPAPICRWPFRIYYQENNVSGVTIFGLSRVLGDVVAHTRNPDWRSDHVVSQLPKTLSMANFRAYRARLCFLVSDFMRSCNHDGSNN